MFIDRNLENYIVHEYTSVHQTLRKIEQHQGQIVFIVTNRDILLGLATNGDIIRWLTKTAAPDLNLPISEVANKKYKYVTLRDEHQKYEELLKAVLFVPVVNEQGQLVAVARREQPQEGIQIGHCLVGKKQPCFVIAEVGNNHNGSMELAKKLVNLAVESGANCVKFQMRDLKSLYANEGNPNDMAENLGSQYTLGLLAKFQLTDQQLFEVFDYCKEKQIMPLCTPWDIHSLEKLEKYGMPAYKLASADLTNHTLIEAIAQTGKPVICSTGMSTEEEILSSVSLLKALGVPHILLHCNSTYPAPFVDINLNYISRLQEMTDGIVGYSGHERDIYASIGAIALGAKVIERHITLDKSMEGSDHKASLLPYEFKEMVKGIRQVEESLGSREARKMSQGEMMNRVNLAKSLIINRNLKVGELIEKDMIEIKSPGKGLQPNYISRLIGRKAKREFKKNDFFYPSDIEDDAVQRGLYNFSQSWGVPVRYHDFHELLGDTNATLVEFHLSYKDMDVDIANIFRGESHLEYVVHSPELFEGDHTLDLTSSDVAYRQHSIKELQRVIDITRSLNKYFPNTSKPLIVTNVGGFTSSGFLTLQERQALLLVLEDSLSKLNMEGVEIIPQTMPPFPWHFGGQQYHNLFVDPDEIVAFCKKNNMRVCLDTSHSMLACTHYRWSFYRFMEKVSPYTAHLHLADAEGTGGEGLQIGEGEIDFYAIAKIINNHAPKASFIPEIWQGHENKGEGFWIALKRLEAVFASHA